MEDAIRMLDKKLNTINLQKQTEATVNKIESAINEIIDITETDDRYTQLKPQALELKRKFEKLPREGDPLPVEEGGRRKTRRFKKKRLMTRKYCKKTACKKMGFTQRASCRPWKNCYRKSKK
jgi:hypothetical protein